MEVQYQSESREYGREKGEGSCLVSKKCEMRVGGQTSTPKLVPQLFQPAPRTICLGLSELLRLLTVVCYGMSAF